jgi:beta-galactosidase
MRTAGRADCRGALLARGRACWWVAGVLVLALGSGEVLGSDTSRVRHSLNTGWQVRSEDPGAEGWQRTLAGSGWDWVSLPHSEGLFDVNLRNFGREGRRVTWYRRSLVVKPEWAGKKLFLEFQGAMQDTTVWVNGEEVGRYAVSGYDPFHFDISQAARAGTNVVAVRVDNRPNRELPPDGTSTDYILFGGLNRDVVLHVTDPVHITFAWEAREAGVRLTLPRVSAAEARLRVECTVGNDSGRGRGCQLDTEVLDQEGRRVSGARSEAELAAGGRHTFVQEPPPWRRPRLWSPADPYRYRVVTRVLEGERELDRWETPLGVRWVRFDRERGFFLNGERLKLVGANRHQSWPFIGNAVPDGLHRLDARMLKAMGVNWVRLAHYPHDPDFLEALDELGLLALGEPATWMDEGPGRWTEHLEASFRRMIRRDRNRACIVVWGTAINHQGAHPALVRAAQEEDPTRDRAQDTVATPMDFRLGEVTGGGALSLEHTGHTFPAARGSREWATRVSGTDVVLRGAHREYDQARRHWEQLDAAYRTADNAGVAVWCFADYNTFHNTDEPGLVWHGVVDLFRLPKLSYWWHQSELGAAPMVWVVRVASTEAVVFSNCEQVRLWADSGEGLREVGVRRPERDYQTLTGKDVRYALRHPPVRFGIPAGVRGLKAEGLMGRTIRARHEWREPGVAVAVRVEADPGELQADGADLSRLVVCVVDEHGTVVETARERVKVSVEGLGQLVGENPVRLRAGQGMILVQSGYVPGVLRVEAQAGGLGSGSAQIRMRALPPGMDLPPDLPVRQPTQRVMR